ncbi:ABC transporter permease [Mobilitalea sibirica]|uniref:ABC transporter permease n=1 Tax=Mobilitalea sibirica TaxID=1462919 RepID=A0A8J7GZ22_9FIRM|nr:ABC transporter permease [Mobilitalea sibirica]MBH1940989.1 ABC transporter permease [Mobilitalea sibirica]
MKNIWLLTKTNVKRNITAVLISIVSGLLLCFMLYAMGYLVADITLSKIRVGVIDQDQSTLSEDFKHYLTKDLDYELIENNSYEQLSTQLIDKDISVIIEIPKDFYKGISEGQKKEILMTSLDDFENVAFLEAYLNSFLGNIWMLADSAGGDVEVFNKMLSDYRLETIEINKAAAYTIDINTMKDRGGFENSIGFYMMFIFGLGVFISFIVLDDRISGVFNRIKITPVKPVHYIIGSGLFGVFICLIEVVIYCGYILLKDIHIGFPVSLLFLMMSLYSLFTVCFCLVIALSLKSKNAAISVIIGFSTVANILGGAYFTLDLAPVSLQNLARILPQFWFMDTFRILLADPVANIYPNIIILSLFTILAFLLGAVLFSQNNRSS